MRILFTKMHGAGNDFVLIDDRSAVFPDTDARVVRALAARRTGVGCEGVVLVRPAGSDAGCDYRMIFLNPDGSRASMCGNATRCLAFFAYENGIGGRVQHMLTDAGVVVAEVLDVHPGSGLVCVQMPPPGGRRTPVCVSLPDGRSVACFYVDTGVPHAVVCVADLQAVDVAGDGRAIRFSPVFAPEGANVDFVQIRPDGRAEMRTYERGVEAESGACGTGAVAAGIALAETRGLTLPVSIRVRSGDRLVVEGTVDGSGRCRDMRLTGPAEKVFEGIWQGASDAGGRS